MQGRKLFNRNPRSVCVPVRRFRSGLVECRLQLDFLSEFGSADIQTRIGNRAIDAFQFVLLCLDLAIKLFCVVHRFLYEIGNVGCVCLGP